MRKTLILLLLAVAAVAVAQSPKREFRSTWLTHYSGIDWPSSNARNNPTLAKQELLGYIQHHADRNFTGICIHARAAADASYASSIEPWAVEITGTRGKNPGWDPLGYAVEQCHARGLECYAWVNPFRFNYGSGSRTTAQDQYVLAQGWIIEYGGKKVFNPALPEVRAYIRDIIKEIYTNYRVDGLLFDDYFYPNDIPADSSAPDYADFVAQNPGKQPTKLNIQNWRRGNINLFMRELYAQIQADRPDMRFGVSPAGVAFKGAADAGVPTLGFGSDWQYDGICSDPLAWLKDGSLDFISPQIYWATAPEANRYSSSAPYIPLATWWGNVATHFNRHFYSSVAAYMFIDGNNKPVFNNVTNWADIGKQIETNRTVVPGGTGGTITYSAKYMDGPLCSGWGDYLQEHQFQGHSLVPVLAWKNAPALTAPAISRQGNVLSWSAPAQSGLDPIMRYTVYAVPANIDPAGASDPAGDGIDGKYLQRVVYGGSYSIPADKQTGYWFAVCAYDGYGNESAPATVGAPQNTAVATEGVTYESAGSLSLENLWFRNVADPFRNIDFESNGALNRGMAVADGKVYVSGRSQSVNPDRVYLRVYDALEGTYLGERTLDIPTAGYACNDIIADNMGTLYVTNLTLNIATTPLTLYKYNPATNKGTALATLTADGGGRVDHASVYAAADGTLTVFAAVANSAKIYRWTVGATTTQETMTVQKFSPAAATSFGIAPRTCALSPTLVAVDGGATYATQYAFPGGNIVWTPSAVTPGTYQANGFAALPERGLMMMPFADHQSADGYKFAIVHDNNVSRAAESLLWAVPQVNMGSVNSTTMSAPVSLTALDGNTALATVYVPGNGLAAYRISANTSGTEAPETTDYFVSGRTICFAAAQTLIEAYRPDGTLAATASGNNLTLPAAGFYIVRAGGVALRIAVR